MDRTEADEEQLWIQKSRQGDHDAFAFLIKHHQRMIYALTFRMTGSAQDAEDLTQEVFIQAYRRLDTYRREAKFSSWLYRIAINLSLNWKKRNARFQDFVQNWKDEAQETGGGDNGSTEKVHHALLQLKPPQRAAVVLTIFDGLSHAEAANALGCSETTVSWRVFTAKAKLKKFLTVHTKTK